jgi:hypothetical protein
MVIGRALFPRIMGWALPISALGSRVETEPMRPRSFPREPGAVRTMHKLEEAAKRLAELRQERAQISAKRSTSDFTILDALDKDIVEQERVVAALRGTPWARAYDLGVRWRVSASPQCLVARFEARIVFDAEFDMGLTAAGQPAGQDNATGVITIREWIEFRYGDPSDDYLSTHPLYGAGLDYYQAHIVENSVWLQEVCGRTRRPAVSGVNRMHVVLTFKPGIVECICGRIHAHCERRSVATVAQANASEVWTE